MNLRTISTRAVVAGTTTVLAAAALVGVTNTAANAEPKTGTGDYTCKTAFADIPVTVSATGDIPVTQLSTGTLISGIPIGIAVDFTVPAANSDALAGFGVNSVGVNSAGFALALGSTNIPINGIATAAPVAPVQDQDLVLPTTSGMLGDFTTPAPGQYNISLPKSFTVDLFTNLLASLPATCTLNEGQDPAILPFLITKQGATVTGKAPATAKKGKPVKVAVTVVGANIKSVGGKVVAMEKGKSLGTGTLKKGKTTITIKGLKPGLHTIDLKYAGDKLTEPAAGGVFVNVKK